MSGITFAKAFREIARKTGMTKSQLAKVLQVSPSAVSHAAKGTLVFGSDVVNRMAVELNLKGTEEEYVLWRAARALPTDVLNAILEDEEIFGGVCDFVRDEAGLDVESAGPGMKAPRAEDAEPYFAPEPKGADVDMFELNDEFEDVSDTPDEDELFKGL